MLPRTTDIMFLSFFLYGIFTSWLFFYRAEENLNKNRYVDVPCLDQSSVILPGDAYIHGNFVHGYNRPNAYILTQGDQIYEYIATLSVTVVIYLVF